ncbi:pilus assembly protein [Paenibacillus larvae]
MKKKSTLLAGLSVLSLTVAVTAAAEEAPATNVVVPSAYSTSSEGIEITPMKVDKKWHDTATGEATVVRTFSINANYGHLKLFMQNHSNKPVTVNLEHINTGLVYFSKTIPAGGSLTWKNFEQGFPQGMRIGDYTLTWSGGGTNVNGEYWGKAASQKIDLP